MVQEITPRETGLRVLYEPQAENDGDAACLDLVAVHGLGAHPDHTWTRNTGSRDQPCWTNWLQDPCMLPATLTNVRIMRYGYHSSWFGPVAIKQTARTVAQKLLFALQHARKHCKSRPLIFVAHSFGGLVVLKLVRDAYHFPNEWSNMALQIRGLLFFGTPFRGAHGMSLGEMLQAAAREFASEDIESASLQILDPGNEVLQDLMDDFGRLDLPLMKIACFYELQASEVGSIVGKQRRRAFVVDEYSGCLDLSGRVRKYPLDRNHFNMNKFGWPDEEDFQLVMGVLQEMVDTALAHNLSQPTIRVDAHAFPSDLSDESQLPSIFQRTKDKAAKHVLQVNCEKMLQSLAFEQMDQRQTTIAPPLRGTGEWLLKSDAFDSWIRGEFMFLWVKGKAGAGKSTVMKRTLEELHLRKNEQQFSLAYFFFDASGTELERSCVGLLRALLHQILSQNRRLLEDFVTTTDDGRFIKGSNLKWQTEELFEVMQICSNLPSWRRTIMLLDALDESVRDEIRPLLFTLQDIFTDTTRTGVRRLSVCLSSRHYPNITMSDCSEIWAEHYNAADIEKFIYCKLAMTSQGSHRDIVDSFVGQADGVFLWVDLVANVLASAEDDGSTRAARLLTLSTTPQKLDDVYSQILAGLSEQERIETFHIFKWVLYAARQLNPVELCFALHLDQCGWPATMGSWQNSPHFVEPGTQTRKFIRSRSRGLLEILQARQPLTSDLDQGAAGNYVVRFVHATVREFLIRRGMSLLQISGSNGQIEGRCHHQIALTCLQYLTNPDIVTCPAITLLRAHPSARGTHFMHWAYPEITAGDISSAVASLSHQLRKYPNKRSHLTSQWYQNLAVRSAADQFNPPGPGPESSEYESSAEYISRYALKDLTKIAFDELPLLDYSVIMLHQHLRAAERCGSRQVAVLDMLLRRGPLSLKIWFAFQDALVLKPKSQFHGVDWGDVFQGLIALGLTSCVSEWRDRVLADKLQMPRKYDFRPAMSIVVNLGASHLVRYIIECGSSPDLRDSNDMSFLDNACVRADARMASALLSQHANVNSANLFGYTSLHHAAKAGSVDILEMLLRAGASVDARLRSGETPLLVAAASDQLAAYRILAAYGADVSVTDGLGRNVSQLAILFRSHMVYGFLHPYEPVMPSVPVTTYGPRDIIDRAWTVSPSPEKQAAAVNARSPAFYRLNTGSSGSGTSLMPPRIPSAQFTLKTKSNESSSPPTSDPFAAPRFTRPDRAEFLSPDPSSSPESQRNSGSWRTSLRVPDIKKRRSSK